MYLFFLITHLICAIVFIGYVFFDVCIYPFAKKTVDAKTLEIVKKAYTKGSAKVFGTAFLYGKRLFWRRAWLVAKQLSKATAYKNFCFTRNVLCNFYLCF